MKINAHRFCPMCGAEHRMEVDANSLREYERGNGFAQDLLPDLNPVEREFLITGYCPECQRRLFGNKLGSEKIVAA